jgi:hypothetical protein
VLLSSGQSFPHLIQKRRSQLGFVAYLLNYPRTCPSAYPYYNCCTKHYFLFHYHRSAHFLLQSHYIRLSVAPSHSSTIELLCQPYPRHFHYKPLCDHIFCFCPIRINFVLPFPTLVPTARPSIFPIFNCSPITVFYVLALTIAVPQVYSLC